MNFSTLFRLEENLNLDRKTLVILRWIAIVGQLIAINLVYFYLQLEFSVLLAYAIVFIGLATNLFLQFKFRSIQIKDFYASIFLIYDLKILESTYYGDGIRGIDIDNYALSNAKSRWLIKVDQGLPILPGKLFFDASGGMTVNNYSVFGMVLGPFIVPLYQSWETENTFPKDINWLLERVRFRLSLDIRLG